ncbi:MAG: 50S ribosomal protein L15 [Microgenomates group bacterium]
MKLNQLPRLITKKKKIIGRGHGSGKGGHTVGRGHKGQKAREKVALTFTGTKIKKSLLKRLPLQRGKGKLKPLKPSPLVVNIKYLNLFKNGEVVNLDSLVKKGIIKEKEKKFGVKILGDGELKVALKVALPCSKGAAKKIKKAGGEIILNKQISK